MKFENNLRSAENILHNPLLLENIFKFLSLKEQLKLTKLCSQFQEVIIYHIWKIEYKKLHVLEVMAKYIILNILPNENLSENDFKEFLKFNVLNIKELKINTFSLLNKCSIIFQLHLIFPNLSKLSIRNIKLTKEDIKGLWTCFPNLQIFSIKCCFRANGAAIHTMKDFDDEVFRHLKTLQMLIVDHTMQNVYLRKK